MPLDYGIVIDYSDRGFGFVSRTLSPGAKVWFHIKTIRRKSSQLADKLDKGSYNGVSFWYDMESTAKGDQVEDLWLKADEIPEPQRIELKARVERLWQDLSRTLPLGFVKLTQDVLGKVDCERLSDQRERRLSEQRKAEEQRRRLEEEERRKAQVEAQQQRLAEEKRRKVEAEERRRAEDTARRLRIAEEQRRMAEAEAVKRQPVEEKRRAAVPPGPTPPVRPRPIVRLNTPSQPPAPAQAEAQTGYFFQQLAASGGSKQASPQGGPRQIETKVAGVTYENRQSVVRQLVVGEQIWLRREPSNSHDRNAIRVERQNGQQIGYISAIEAATLAPSFDAYGRPVPATVTAIVGGSYSYSAMGVRIRFTVPETGAGKPAVIPDFDDNWEH